MFGKTFALFVSLVFATFIVAIVADLAYNAPDIYDGDCSRYPKPVSLLNSNLMLYSPFPNNYIPLASKSIYRYEYRVMTNANAETEEQIASLRTRVQAFNLAGILAGLGDFTVSFFGNSSFYSYLALPTIIPPTVFNLTATTRPGSNPSTPSNYEGTIVFTVIRCDASSWTVWGCIGGNQNFHIISRYPTLTAAQYEANKVLLTGLGFNLANFQNMTYT